MESAPLGRGFARGDRSGPPANCPIALSLNALYTLAQVGFQGVISPKRLQDNSSHALVYVANAARRRFLGEGDGAVHRAFGHRDPPDSGERLYAFTGIAGLIIVVWLLGHLIGGNSGSMNPLNFFTESSTMGTILILVVYFLANLALPFYYRRYRPQEFSVVKHIILPVLGLFAIGVPVYYLSKPGQPQPYNWFPYAALVIVVAAVAYSIVASRRDPELGERAGSIIADE